MVFPNQDVQAAVQRVRLACVKLMSETLELGGTNAALSIAAGIVSTTNPSASPTVLRSAADKVQYRAKVRSKSGTPRPSVIAVENQDEMIVLEHV